MPKVKKKNSKELFHWGFVFNLPTEEDENIKIPHLSLINKEKDFFYPEAITDHSGNYKNLGDSQISIARVQIMDGTEPLEVQEALDRIDKENIFFSIEDINTISFEKGKKTIPVIEVLSESPQEFLKTMYKIITDAKKTVNKKPPLPKNPKMKKKA